jgi:hypothetical protein
MGVHVRGVARGFIGACGAFCDARRTRGHWPSHQGAGGADGGRRG